jgi:hypothetical protein
MRHNAWLGTEEGGLQGCVVVDISETGARLRTENAEAVPVDFVLLLSKRGAPRRYCHVVRRGQDHIGVEFENPQNIRLQDFKAPSIMPDDDEDAGDGGETGTGTVVAAETPADTNATAEIDATVEPA